MCKQAREQLPGAGFSLPLYGSQVLKAGCQAWQPVPLSTEVFVSALLSSEAH